MLKGLEGARVAILCAGEVAARDIEAAKKTLTAAGATPVVIPGDIAVEGARAAEYAGLVLLGAAAAETTDGDPAAVQLVREFMAAEKPVGAIGGGARLLIAADAVAGRTLTSSLELASAIHKAGGDWVDRPVEVDDTLITSRSPADLPAFTDRVVQEFSRYAEQLHADQATDQLSEQSFPASDPPPGPTAIGGKGAEKKRGRG